MSKRIKIAVSTCFICLIFVSSTFAATISQNLTSPMVEMGCHFQLDGVIKKGDAQKLQNKISVSKEEGEYLRLLSEGWKICLSSPGGSYLEGVELAYTIARSGLGTAVLPQHSCESACAIAFLGGTYSHPESETSTASRTIHATANLGFHAPSLNIPEGASYTAETVSKAYDIALQAVVNLSDMRSSGFDIPESLFKKILTTPAAEMFYIDTVGKAVRYNVRVVGVYASAGDVNSAAEYICDNAVVAIEDKEPWFGGGGEFKFIRGASLHKSQGYYEEANSDCSIKINTESFSVSFGQGYNDDSRGFVTLPLYSSFKNDKLLREAHSETTILGDEFLIAASKLQNRVPKSCAVQTFKTYVTNVENSTNLRQKPGLNGRIIAQIPYGAVVWPIRPESYLRYDRCAAACEGANQNAINACIENNDIWIEVRYLGDKFLTGFLSRKFLE